MKRFYKYSDFILESKIELLLEAQIKFKDDFIETLQIIDNRISNEILKLNNKEVDVNTNYIDINTDRDDVITFLPDDKVEKVPYVVIGHSYYDLISKRLVETGYDGFSKYIDPKLGDKGTIIKEFTLEEMIEISPNNKGVWEYIYVDRKLVHFRTDYGSDIIFNSDSLRRDFSTLTRTQLKVGRFVRSLLTKAGVEFTDREIEEFVDKFKAVIQLSKDVFARMEEVKGNDIGFWYHEENYDKITGTLGSSCMRYELCQTFFDIYTDNPEVVSLVILKSKTNKDKITARALLWTDSKGRKIMDRIYTNNSADVEIFLSYCEEKGYYHRESQNSVSINKLVYQGDIIETDITVFVKPGDYEEYPYMDTLKYYNISNGTLSNNVRIKSDNLFLEITNGRADSCSICSNTGQAVCPECDGDGCVSCDTCDGDAYTSCHFCDGREELDCPECLGHGDDCKFCDNAGTLDCPECLGSGLEDCRDCNQGRIGCDMCSGYGTLSCPNC